MQLTLNITTMSRLVLVSYELLDVRFPQFFEPKMRFFKVLHLLFYLYTKQFWKFVLINLLQCEICTKTAFSYVTSTNWLI